jgi:hypothetical protein
MIIRTMLGFVLACLDRLERVLDYDPVQGHARRLAALERKFDELSASRQNDAGAREPSLEVPNRASSTTAR